MSKETRFRGWTSIIVVFLVVAMSIVVGVAQGKRDFTNINSRLKAMRKPAVKSIQSSDGDIIDCVSIHNQPAFDHPALKNHTIQMRPSFMLEEDATNNEKNSSRSPPIDQVWHKSGSCPDGTIPIRRVKKEDLQRFDKLERFGMKAPPPPMDSNVSYPDRTLIVNNTSVSLGPRRNHSSATLLAMVVHYTGARGTITVWNPRVARWDEYTTGQLWLMSGDPTNFESVEAGWIVNKKLYGDTRTRFFTYWTADASRYTGCFDLVCSGFVQVSTQVVVGGAFEPVSTLGGQQYAIPFQITTDGETGNWWLTLNEKDFVGYWPASLFSSLLKQGASYVQWGDEVYSEDIRKQPHTTTAMGSGQFTSPNPGYSAYIQHIRVHTGLNLEWVYPKPEYIGIYTDEVNCYAAIHHVRSFTEEPVLYFGGPGKNALCP